MSQVAGARGIEAEPDVTGVFPRRPRPGLVMGLRLGQIAVSAAAGLAATLAVFTSITTGISRGLLLGCAAALVVTAAATVEDRTGYGYLGARVSHAWRARRGNTAMGRPVHVGSVGRFPAVEGTVGLLPGRAACLRVYEADGVAYLVHPGQGTITAVVEVASPEFLLRDPAERNARVAGWGRVLAATTRTGAVRQLQLLERSIPDDGSDLAAYSADNLTTHPGQLELAEVYGDLIAGLNGGADRHETYLAVTVDTGTSTRRAQVRAAGGRTSSMVTAWRQEYALIARLLPAAGLDVVATLDARRLGHVIRTAFDPTAPVPAPGRGVDLAAAGPMAGREAWDHLRTDGAFHAVLWVAEWPRSQVTADVLWPLVFPPGVHRGLSVFYRPFTRAQSEAAVRAKHSEILQSSWLKTKLGRVETLADTKEMDDVLARESELLAGHGEVALTGMVTVTAATREDLEQAVVTVHAAGTQAGLDLRRLYGQQLQAVTAAALPLGIEVTA